MRLIDGDALEREGWSLCRTFQKDECTMVYEVKKPSDFPAIEERKTGEWIEDGYNHYKAVCSECGEPCGTYVMGKPRDNYCKWCGADMRGEEHG